jgi:hypothetical protein
MTKHLSVLRHQNNILNVKNIYQLRRLTNIINQSK